MQFICCKNNARHWSDKIPDLLYVFSSTQASGNSQTKSLSGVHTHKKPTNQENVATLDNDSMLLPHDRIVGDFSWLHASQEKEPTFKATTHEFEDEELFLYGNFDSTQQISKTRSADSYQNGGQSKQELNILTSQTRKQVEPTLGGSGDFVPQQPLQVSSSSFASSYLDSSECEKLKNILKSVNLASKTERNTQRPREEKHMYPVPQGSGSEPPPPSKPAVNETNVLQALESLQSLIKGEVSSFFISNSFFCYIANL